LSHLNNSVRDKIFLETLIYLTHIEVIQIKNKFIYIYLYKPYIYGWKQGKPKEIENLGSQKIQEALGMVVEKAII
jgi:hypothetical protein